MKIGLFDSGLGGLTVAKEVISLLPQYDYLYLGDNARAPYGTRSQQEIYEFTQQGVNWLFEQGAALVILACGTASSQALRRLQQEWLPIHFPDRKLLGIIIPIAQEVAVRSKGKIGIIATPATIASQTYSKELRKIKQNLTIIQIAAPELVPLIERGAGTKEITPALGMYLIPLQQAGIDALILGSTHYQLIYTLAHELVGESVYIPHTGEIVAKKLQIYLNHHPEIETKFSKDGTQEFFTTGRASHFAELSQRFIGYSIIAKQISL